MSTKDYLKLPLISRIKFWKDKYRDMPNGWVVGQLIGEQYINSKANMSPQKREKLKKRGL